MKANRSLALSSKIQECKMGNIIGLLETEFPCSIFENQNEVVNETKKLITDNQGRGKKVKKRERVFTEKNTLLTMVLTSAQQDKTLKNSVDLFYIIHQKQKSQALDQIEQLIEQQKIENSKLLKRKVGRQKKSRYHCARV